jgi:hypothetical protein
LRVCRRIVSEIARDEPVYERDGEIAIKPRRLQSQRGRYRPHEKRPSQSGAESEKHPHPRSAQLPEIESFAKQIGKKSPIDAVPVQSGYIDIRLK